MTMGGVATHSTNIRAVAMHVVMMRGVAPENILGGMGSSLRQSWAALTGQLPLSCRYLTQLFLLQGQRLGADFVGLVVFSCRGRDPCPAFYWTSRGVSGWA